MENSFLLGSSQIAPAALTTQGSKVLLVWETSPSWDDPENPPTVETPEDLKAIVSYPRPGQSNGTVEILCRSAEVTVFPGSRVEVLCQFDGDIHGTAGEQGRIGDTVTFETPAPPNHWLSNGTDQGERLTGQNTAGIANNSGVLYPQAVASWDVIPHQLAVAPGADGFLHLEIAAAHRYGYPGSPFGDLAITVQASKGLDIRPPVPATPDRQGFRAAGLSDLPHLSRHLSLRRFQQPGQRWPLELRIHDHAAARRRRFRTRIHSLFRCQHLGPSYG